ncbi:MAG TPA: hypothetical protein DCF93_02870 [Desulfuromonas sp.]|nr:hypothetical protein [Desulfuromonas sp.]
MERFDFSQEELAKRVGKERSTVANALRLLKLPARIQTQVSEGKLAMGHARALLALDHADDMQEAAAQVVQKGLSVRETEALVKKIREFGAPKTKGKVVKATDPQLIHLAGELKRALATQVKILPKGKGGKIEISFFSPQDLERLLEVLGIA